MGGAVTAAIAGLPREMERGAAAHGELRPRVPGTSVPYATLDCNGMARRAGPMPCTQAAFCGVMWATSEGACPSRLRSTPRSHLCARRTPLAAAPPAAPAPATAAGRSHRRRARRPAPPLHAKDRHHTRDPCSEERQRIKGALTHPQRPGAGLQRGSVERALGAWQMVVAL